MPTRTNRHSLFLGHPPPTAWPPVPEEAVPAEHLPLFSARVQTVNLYFKGLPLKDIESLTGIGAGEPKRLAKRCLTPADHGGIQGFAALIPHRHIERYLRTAALRPKRRHQRGGMAGALTAILNTYPDLKELLVALIKKEASEVGIPEFRLRGVTLHRIFLKALRKLGVPGTQWPFTSEYQGERSIMGYMRHVRDEHFSHTVATREEQWAKAHLPVGKGIPSLLTFEDLYQAVEIDAYHIDALLTVLFKTPKGFETPVLLERLWLLAAVERLTSAVLAFSIVFKTEIGADDVVRLIRNAISPDSPLPELNMPGLQYPPDSGFPAQVCPSLGGAVWTVTMLDRALQNQARSVRERARRQLGFVINWGPARHFERRPNIERLFWTIHTEVFGRLPSTTGSHPHKRRAPDAAQQALKRKIRAQDAEQQAAVHVLQHNVTPSEGLSWISPLEAIGQALERDDGHFLPRQIPMSPSNGGNLLTVREIRTVRGNEAEGRRPYVQIDRVHYTSPVLSEAGGLINEKVIVQIDEEDMRQVELYLMDGTPMGALTAVGQWLRTKHDRKTRKAINTLMAKRVLVVSQFDDPVLAFLAHLSTPIKQRRPMRADEVPGPRDATEATRVAQAAGVTLHLNDKGAAVPAYKPAPEIPYMTPKMRSTPSVMSKPAPDVKGLINRGKAKSK